MTHDGERPDPTLDRLRDADPARGVEADLASLRTRVAGRVGTVRALRSPGAEQDLPIEVPGSADVVELAPRRRRPLRALGVAAALAVVAVSGYGLGQVTMGGAGAGAGDSAAEGADGDAGTAEDAAPPITLDAPVGELGASEDQASAGSEAADMSMPYGSGRVQFTASGLGTSGGSAPAWGLDATSGATAERAAQAAAVLGIQGEPEQRDGAWIVGANGELSISFDGTASLYAYLPDRDPYSCDENGECTEADPATRPADDVAIATLRDTMAALGVDVAAYTFQVMDESESATAYVSAELVIDGRDTGLRWDASVGAEGLAHLSGFLAEVVPLNEYPVVSEQEAFGRLTDPRFGAQPTGWPEVYDLAAEEYTPPTAAPAPPAADAPVSWPVGEVMLTGVQLTVATQYQPDGAVLLVPTYEFADSDGGTWAVIAVTDDRLDFAG